LNHNIRTIKKYFKLSLIKALQKKLSFVFCKIKKTIWLSKYEINLKVIRRCVIAKLNKNINFMINFCSYLNFWNKNSFGIFECIKIIVLKSDFNNCKIIYSIQILIKNYIMLMERRALNCLIYLFVKNKDLISVSSAWGFDDYGDLSWKL